MALNLAIWLYNYDSNSSCMIAIVAVRKHVETITYFKHCSWIQDGGLAVDWTLDNGLDSGQWTGLDSG